MKTLERIGVWYEIFTGTQYSNKKLILLGQWCVLKNKLGVSKYDFAGEIKDN